MPDDRIIEDGKIATPNSDPINGEIQVREFLGGSTFSALSAVRETQTTSAPAVANLRAMARPMPRLAPVTTAIC